MKKQLLSLPLLIALVLLTADASRCSEWTSTPQPIDFAAEATEPPAKTPPLCAARGKNCGSIDDDCGGKIDCGPCTSPNICGGGGVPNVCGCKPKSCDQRQCGAIDPGCGLPPVSCGSCPAGQECMAGHCEPGTGCRGGVPRCVCGECPPCGICPFTEPRALSFCAAKGKNCGLIDDGRGGQVDCGTCKGPETCGGGGVSNVCGRPRKK